MSPTGGNLSHSQLALSFFTVSEISVRSAEAQGHIPHLSPWEMIREKLIPRASWKPNHQPMTSTGPKLQKYGDAAPKPVWRWTTRPKKTHKSWHSCLFRGCFLWFRSNCQRKAQRERERERFMKHRASLSSICLSLSPDEKPVCWLIGEWCCYLESSSISWRSGGETARASSPGCTWADGWAVKCPIVQITQQARCHRQGLIYRGATLSQPDWRRATLQTWLMIVSALSWKQETCFLTQSLINKSVIHNLQHNIQSPLHM